MSETLGAALIRAARQLAAAGVPDPGRDARVLIAWAAGIDAPRLRAAPETPLSAGAATRLARALADRAARRPVAQIIGRREFWGRSFRVTGDVLDPRPETELIVDRALAGSVPGRLLDLGTGSGALAVTLLCEWPAARGVATDASPAALAVAGENAAALDVAARLDLVEADWLRADLGRFDLIVCNPPYIAAAQIADLDRDVRDWEPRSALTPGADALASYRAIAPDLAARLQPGGRAIFEFGIGQGPAVAAVFRAAGAHTLALHADLSGRDRIAEVAFST
ncbi:MAG: peptide chain release factor N(5)-glutamine methyltransferase [Pseudomonadota bacterium]